MLRAVLGTSFTEINKPVVILMYGTYSLVPCLSGRAAMGGESSINYSLSTVKSRGSQKRVF